MQPKEFKNNKNKRTQTNKKKKIKPGKKKYTESSMNGLTADLVTWRKKIVT